MNTNEHALYEDVNFLDDGTALFQSTQVLGDDFFDELNEAKDNFAFRLNGLTPVASIPEATVNRWLREGFDFWNAPANEITKKLRMESMEKFIISGDKTF